MWKKLPIKGWRAGGVVILIGILFALTLLMSDFGDSQAIPEEPEPEPEETPPEPEPELEPEPEEEVISREGQERNPLSGEWVDEARARRRPLAVMLDNNVHARPHRGVIEADVVFEMLVEGGATRLMPVYLAGEPEVVGPVRSARDYHLDLVLGLNAVMVHCGGSPGAYAGIRDLGVDVLNDLWGQGRFFREPKEGVPYEHTLFTRLAVSHDLIAGSELEENSLPEPMWDFQDESSQDVIQDDDVGDAASFTLVYPGSMGYEVMYRYQAKMQHYERWIGANPYRDRDTGEPLKADNVLVMWVDTWRLPGDAAGRLGMDFTGDGAGLLISGGRTADVRWEKQDLRSPLRFFDEEGELAQLKTGQTWVQVLPTGTDIVWEEPRSESHEPE